MPVEPSRRPPRITAAAGLALVVVVGWNFTATGAAALPLSDATGAGLATIGLLTTVMLLAEALTLVPAGRLLDRHGPRRVSLAGLALLGGAGALALVTPSTPLLMASRALVGVGLGLGFAAALVYLRPWGPLGQGMVGGLALAGSGAAVALVPHLAGPLGWRAPFVPEVALAAAALPLVAVAYAPPIGAGRQAGIGVPAMLRAGGVPRNVAAVSVSFMASFAAGAWVVPLLTRSEHFGAQAAGLAGSLVLFGGMLTRPLGGAVGRRRPGAVPAVARAAVLAAGAALVVLGLDLGVAAGVLAALAVGLAAGLPFGPANAAVAAAVPQAAGTAVAAANAIATVAGVATVFGLGVAFEAGVGRAGFVALGLAVAVAAPLMPRGGPLRPRPAPARPRPARRSGQWSGGAR